MEGVEKLNTLPSKILSYAKTYAKTKGIASNRSPRRPGRNASEAEWVRDIALKLKI
jgi:hypothetical protein